MAPLRVARLYIVVLRQANLAVPFFIAAVIERARLQIPVAPALTVVGITVGVSAKLIIAVALNLPIVL